MPTRGSEDVSAHMEDMLTTLSLPKNACKMGWEGQSIPEGYADLLAECKELRIEVEAKNLPRIIEEAIDVSIQAMIIAQNAKRELERSTKHGLLDMRRWLKKLRRFLPSNWRESR